MGGGRGVDAGRRGEMAGNSNLNITVLHLRLPVWWWWWAVYHVRCLLYPWLVVVVCTVRKMVVYSRDKMAKEKKTNKGMQTSTVSITTIKNKKQNNDPSHIVTDKENISLRANNASNVCNPCNGSDYQLTSICSGVDIQRATMGSPKRPR